MEHSKEQSESIETAWEKVAIEGSIFENNVEDLDGLIGLEVMEKYDESRMITYKKKHSSHTLEGTEYATARIRPIKRKKMSPGQYVLLKNYEVRDMCEGKQVLNVTDNCMKLWAGLGVPDLVLKSLMESNFITPTPIQLRTIPAAILEKKNIVGAAETGSGKTLAFAIPVLSGIIELKNSPIKISQNTSKHLKPLYAIILIPTRELAVQVRDHIISVAKYTGIQIAAVFGGIALVKQERILRKCPEIVIATPGRLWELLEKGNEHLNKIDQCNFLVIDETDRMMERGHFEELHLVLKRLNRDRSSLECRQNFIFSATLTMISEIQMHGKHKFFPQKFAVNIETIIKELGISQPYIVDLTNVNQTSEKLTESRINCSFNEKDYYLYYFIQKYSGRTIVFCNSIECVKRLRNIFQSLNCKPLALHSQMSQKQRLGNLEKFREKSNSLLVATDIAARGLDILDVHHVVHYQIPRNRQSYVHRCGRTARANKNGITIVLMEPSESQHYINICNALSKDCHIPLFPIENCYLKTVKDRVNLAREVNFLELKLKRKYAEEGWLNKTAAEMDITVENSDSSDDEDAHNHFKNSYISKRRKTLTKLLSKPLFKEEYNIKKSNGMNKASQNICAIQAVLDSINSQPGKSV